MRTLTALAVLLACPAYAQQQCAERDAMISRLSSEYGEALQYVGIIEEVNVMEMWANTDSGNWTTLITRPDGVSCIVAFGEYFLRIDEAPEPAGIDG